MSAELSASIRPVSARYAAQIKELLTHQIRQRISEVEQAAQRPPPPPPASSSPSRADRTSSAPPGPVASIVDLTA